MCTYNEQYSWFCCTLKLKEMSLDMFVGLRKKSIVPGTTTLEQKLRQAGAPEIFGQSDVVPKHLLEVRT